MSAKERLRDLVEEMTEEEAAVWLKKLEASAEDEDWRPSWLVKLDEATARVPEEDWEKFPPSDKVDEVLYGKPQTP